MPDALTGGSREKVRACMSEYKEPGPACPIDPAPFFNQNTARFCADDDMEHCREPAGPAAEIRRRSSGISRRARA